MALTSRRQFVQQMAFGATAPYGPALVLGEARRIFEAREQNAAPLDEAAIRKFASEMKGHITTTDSRECESSLRCGDRARVSAPSGHRSSVRTMTYPPGRIPELLQAFVNFVAAAPDEMNVVGQVLPSEKGTQFRMLVCHCGDLRQGNELLRPLRTLKPQEDKVKVMPYLEAQAAAFLPAPVAHFQTDLFLPEFSAGAIAAITTATNDALPNNRVFIVPLYGAISRVGLSDMAFALRCPGYEVDIVGTWSAPAEQSAVQWLKLLRDNLRPFAHGMHVNQLGETSEELVRTAYGPNYARLIDIKKKYDPKNVLRLNQNIKPD